MKHLVVALVAFVAALVASGTAAGQPVRVPGTRVSLEAPDGFSPAKQFPGFENVALRAALMVTELPGPAAEMRRGMTKSALASRGMTLVSSSSVAVGGSQGSLLYVRQSTPAGEVSKWMLITGDQTTTMIVGSFPTTAERELSDTIRRSLLSVTVTVESAPDPFEGLTFRVTPTRRLRIAGRMSSMLVLSESGTLSPADPDVGFYIVGHSMGAAKMEGLQSFSEARARQTTHTTDIRNITGRSITLDALPAYELQADATDPGSGRVMKMYQVIGVDDDGYVIIQGFVSARRSAEVLPEFKKVTATFQRSPR